MIKLIITDLDGTLLNDEKNLPDDFWHIEQELKQMGITLVIASGRQYYTMADQFKPIIDDVYLLAENGALVLKGTEQIHCNPLDKEIANTLIKKGRKVSGAWPILCGRESAYVEDNHGPLLDEANKYYKRLEVVDDLTKVDDLVLKFTMCDFDGSQENSFKYFEDLQHLCKVAVAGKIWLDMTNLTTSKGTALTKIMEHCDISPDEVMAFGDYMNDMDMIEVAHHSYAMKNSHPSIIEAARFITTHDNNNSGVTHELRKYFNLPYLGR